MSRSPYDPAPLEGVGEGEMQFSQVKSQATGPETSVSELLHLEHNLAYYSHCLLHSRAETRSRAKTDTRCPPDQCPAIQ